MPSEISLESFNYTFPRPTPSNVQDDLTSAEVFYTAVEKKKITKHITRNILELFAILNLWFKNNK